MTFFQDSDGNQSYGRLASYTCIAAAIVAAFTGHEVFQFLGAGVSFYLASKGQQVACNIWGKPNA
jgi:hypothetical protein